MHAFFKLRGTKPQTLCSARLRAGPGFTESISGIQITVFALLRASLGSLVPRVYSFSFMTLHSQYALRSVYPASFTHIGQDFGSAVSMDTAGALFVGAPNQLTSGAIETQNGAVHVLQLHSSPVDSALQSSTVINSLSPLNKPIGTSCAALLQQVLSHTSHPPGLAVFLTICHICRDTLCPAFTSSSPLRMLAHRFQFTARWSRSAAVGACVIPAMA